MHLKLLALCLLVGTAFGQSTPVTIPYVKGGVSNFPYSATVTYQQGQMVDVNGVGYVSKAGGNLNNDPATTPSMWYRPSPAGASSDSSGNLSVPGSISQAQVVNNTGRVDGRNMTEIVGAPFSSTPCMLLTGGCTTTGSDTHTVFFGAEGQNVPKSVTIWCIAMGDCLTDEYWWITGGDDMPNMEGQGGHQVFWIEHGSPTFTVSETGPNLPTIHQPNIEVGQGRYIVSTTPDWTGTVGSGALQGNAPFAQANLAGRTDAAGHLAEFSQNVMASPNAVTIPINTSASQPYVQNSTNGFVAGGLACIAEQGNAFRFFELRNITAVSGGAITVDKLRFNHSGSAIVATGGLCGYGLEQTAVTINNGGALQVWPLMTSIDGSGTVMYPQGRDGLMVGIAGTTAWTATANGAKLYKLAVVDGYDATTRAYQLSASLINWSNSQQYISPNGLDSKILGLKLYSNTLTPGLDHNTLLTVSASGYNASHDTDRAAEFGIGGSRIPGSQPFAVVGVHGGATFGFDMDGVLNGAFWEDFANRTASTITTNNVLAFGSGGALQHLSGNGQAGWAITGDYLNLPSATNIIWSRDNQGPCWGYNGTSCYIGLHNSPSGGYGTGDTWLSLDGASPGDQNGNLQVNTLKTKNGFTGTCASGHSLVINSGIVTGCQ